MDFNPAGGNYGVKILEACQGSGLTFPEGPKLGPGSRSSFKARAQPGLVFLGLDPSLTKSLFG